MSFIVAALLSLSRGINGWMLYFYDAGTDAIATVNTAGYFNNADDNISLNVDDEIKVKASDGVFDLIVTAISAAGSVTTTFRQNPSSVVNVTDATVTLTAELHANRIVTLNRAAGITATLPAATGTGNKYTVITGTTVSSNANIIQAASASDSFAGLAVGVDTDAEGASGYTWNADVADDTITMTGTTNGGVAGDAWEIIDYASGLFMVNGRITQSGGSEVTPFTAAVS